MAEEMITNEIHRPFFSVVVACYNPRKYLAKLLLSIVNQHIPEDIEVILSDDHSPEPYDDVVDQFKNFVHIKRIMTDYNFAPGNTRQKGTEIATGEWLCFADQDDEFYPDTLAQVMKRIKESGEQIYAVADFNECRMDGTIYREFRATLGWCHAKFYNLDNMWKNFGMAFKKDLRSHEDIYICSLSNCIMNFLNNREPLYIPVVVYCWYQNPESLTHSKYVSDAGTHSFLEFLFADYIDSTASVYYDQFLKNNITLEYARTSMIEVLAYCYFYMMGFIFHDPEGFIRDNFTYSKNLLVAIKRTFNLNNQGIWDILAANDAKSFTEIRKASEIGSGPYIPHMTIMQWMNMLDKDIEAPIEQESIPAEEQPQIERIDPSETEIITE